MKPTFRSVFAGLFALLLLLSVVLSPTAHADKKGGKQNSAKAAKPGISWNTKRVVFAAGGATSRTVQLVSTTDAQNVRLQVTGGLSNYISVAPSAAFNMVKNQPVNVTITLKALPANAHTQAGVVQVRTSTRSLGRPLGVKIQLQRGQDD